MRRDAARQVVVDARGIVTRPLLRRKAASARHRTVEDRRTGRPTAACLRQAAMAEQQQSTARACIVASCSNAAGPS